MASGEDTGIYLSFAWPYAIKINLRMVPNLVAYKTIPQKMSNCCKVLLSLVSILLRRETFGNAAGPVLVWKLCGCVLLWMGGMTFGNDDADTHVRILPWFVTWPFFRRVFPFTGVLVWTEIVSDMALKRLSRRRLLASQMDTWELNRAEKLKWTR